jgi:hypothetical protein
MVFSGGRYNNNTGITLGEKMLDGQIRARWGALRKLPLKKCEMAGWLLLVDGFAEAHQFWTESLCDVQHEQAGLVVCSNVDRDLEGGESAIRVIRRVQNDTWLEHGSDLGE